MPVLTKTAAEVYAPTDAGGHPRAPSLGDAVVYHTEIERMVMGSSGLLVPDTSGSSWMDGKAPAIISRAVPKFLTPEMYIGLETQIIYCPAEEPNDYSGATDWAPAIAAMRQEILASSALLGDSEWPPTSAVGWKRHKFGIAFQPGHRYAFDAGANFTDILAKGLTINGFGATLIGRYDGGGPLLDCIGSHGLIIRDLHGESDNGAQPNFAFARGRTAQLRDAADVVLDNVRFHGWWKLACEYNASSEIGRADGEWTNYASAPAVWIDSENRLGIENYSQTDGSTYVQGTVGSTIQHWYRGNIRCISGSKDGALKITSSAAESSLSRVKGVYVDAYLTNNGTVGNSERRPAVYVEGPVESLHLRQHCELGVKDGTLHQSHVVYYANPTGLAPMRQWDHRIEDFLSEAEIAIIGGDNSAIHLEACDISIGGSRGEYPSGTEAKLFDAAGCSGMRWSGNLRVRGQQIADPANFYNLNAVAFCDVDIEGDVLKAHIQIGVGSRYRLKSTNASERGALKKSVLIVNANGAVAVANHDIVQLQGPVTAISLGNGFGYHAFEVLNNTANHVTISGLLGPNCLLAPGQSVNITQWQSSFAAAGVGMGYGKTTPTVNGEVNVTSVTAGANSQRWSRIGEMLRCSGEVEITPSAAGATRFRMSLPLASAIAATGDVAGTFSNGGGVNGAINGDVANDAATFTFTSPGGGPYTLSYAFEADIL